MNSCYPVKIPSTLNYLTVKNIISSLNGFFEQNESNVLLVDFSDTKFVYPGGLTPLLTYLLDLKEKNSNIDGAIISSNHDAENYIARMGFYDLLGVDGKYDFQKHDGTGKFQELYLFSSNIPFAEVEQRKENVIKIFTLDHTNQNYINAINWCIPELVSNAYDHSKSDTSVLFAQRYKHWTEFCISDRGLGIKNTMGRGYDILTALEKSIQKQQKGIESEGYGNGLYFTSELIKNDHSKTKSIMNIHSENGILTITSGQDAKIEYVDSFWNGTTVTLKIFDNIEKDISDLLGYTPYGAEDLEEFYDIFESENGGA